jgi:peptidoglycan/LPS O-acetylase OafA/YrhL
MAQSLITPTPRYEFLDALRGLAILGVISTHCATFAQGDFPLVSFAAAGRNGVQLFFMVSAFTIFMTLERALSRESAVIRSFFIRRVLRILPMFWVGIVLYAFAPGRMPCPIHIDMGFSYYLVAALLQHGWHPYYLNTIVPGGWSIAVEVTFYIIAPFLFFRIRNWQGALFFLLIALLICVTANNGLHFLINHQLLFRQLNPELVESFSQFWFPSQLPVFACGILAYYIFKSLPESFRSRRNGLLLLVTALTSVYTVVGINGYRLISVPTFFALGFILLVLALAIYPFPVLVNPVTCFLGRISYSVYLMHFLILQLAIQAFQAYLPVAFSKPLLAYVLLFAATLAFVTPLSWMTYKLIEQPFIRLGSSLVRRLNSASESGLKKHSVIA